MNEDKKYDLIVILINIINGVVVIRLRSWWNDGARCIANTEKEKKNDFNFNDPVSLLN